MYGMAPCNSLYPFLLIVLSFVFITTKGQSVCTYNNKSYAECEFMFWLNWTTCDGRDCPLGKEKRLKGICCSQNSLEPSTVSKSNCKRNCNFTDADFEETRNGAFNKSQLSGNQIQEERGVSSRGRVITGASIGVIAVAVLLGLFVFFLHRQLKKKKENRNVVPEKKW